MLKRLSDWYRRWRGRDICEHCREKLDDDNYCFDCNHFSHKKWLTEAEALWIEEVKWMKRDPLGYERYQDEMRELLHKHGIGKHHERETRSPGIDEHTAGEPGDRPEPGE